MGLCPKPRDLSLSSKHAPRKGRRIGRPIMLAPGRRSGSIPGEPCPPLRHDQHSVLGRKSLFTSAPASFAPKSGALGRAITQRRPRADIPASPKNPAWEPSLRLLVGLAGLSTETFKPPGKIIVPEWKNT